MQFAPLALVFALATTTAQPATGGYTLLTAAGTDGASGTSTEDNVSVQQGFAVKVLDPDPAVASLSYKAAYRIDSSGEGESAERSTSSTFAQIRLRLTGTLTSGPAVVDDAIGVVFAEGSGPGWDGYDASKLSPFSADFVEFALMGQGRDGSIVPKASDSYGIDIQDVVVVPGRFRASAAGAFELTWAGTALPSGWTAVLRDLDTGDVSDLTVSGAYAFTSDGSVSERFEIVTSPPIVTISTSATPGYRLLSVPGAARTVDQLAQISLVSGAAGYTVGDHCLPGGTGPAGDRGVTNLFTGYTGDETATNGGYTAPATGATQIQPGAGFYWYFFGEDNPNDRFPTACDDATAGDPSVARALPLGLPYVAAAETDVTVPVAGRAANDDAFFLAGNPFTQGLDLEDLASLTGAGSVTATGPGNVIVPLSNVVQAFNPATGGYTLLTATADTGTDGAGGTSAADNVSVWQGFVVEALDPALAVTSLSYKAAYRTGSSDEGEFVGRSARPTFAQIRLGLTGTLDGGPAVGDDAIGVVFAEGSGPGWDGYDASKLSPFSADFVEFALMGQGRDGSIVPKASDSYGIDIQDVVVVPGRFRASAAGAFELTWAGTALPSGWTAVLRDLDTGDVSDLTVSGAYAFTSDGSVSERFEIVTSPLIVPSTDFTITTAGAYVLSSPQPGLTVADLAALNLVIGVPGYAAGTPNLRTAYDGTKIWSGATGAAEVLQLGMGFQWILTGVDRNYRNGSISQPFPTTLSTTTANEADVTVPLETDGFRVNIYGNPFGVPLDVTDVASWPNGTKVGFVWLWDVATQRWLYDPAVTQVEPWQAFFIRTRPGRTGTLTIPASAAIGSAAWEQAQSAKAPTATPGHLRFDLDGRALDGAPLADGALALVMSDGEAEPKLAPLSNAYVAAGFSTTSGDSDVLTAIETLRADGGSRELPITITTVGAERDLTLRWGASTLPADWRLTLVDRKTGATADLSSAGRYAFEADSAPAAQAIPDGVGMLSAGGSASRFVLRIDAGDGVAKNDVELALAAPVPNPTDGRARVAFTLVEAGAVHLSVFDALGRQVAVLADGPRVEGAHAVSFDASRLAAGMYVIRLEAGGQVLVQRATIVR